ncbi:MAG TPA: hypothetical protein VK712_02860 [Verrucomicrobiae bacterium]|jgi:hypothetical protein|nr:hypothetical protein [Verrucomicrobiae bacterium]
MKQKDLALIVVIVFLSAIISLFLSKAIFVSPKNREQKVDVVQPITADFPQPDSQYFNSNSNDPTQLITIGQNANTNPFNGTTTSQ